MRSYLIHRLGPLHTPTRRRPIKRLANEPDLSIRRALILSLGEYGEGDLVVEDREALVPMLQQIDQTAADPGLHAAAEWLFCRGPVAPHSMARPGERQLGKRATICARSG